ncbi:MAG TPA: septum formation initiator family protein [Vicinamibacterales bacterium]|nr:septum formation initiator family protein [Vicinamibacterales bacterium]
MRPPVEPVSLETPDRPRPPGTALLRRRRVPPAPGPPRWRRILNGLIAFVVVVLAVDALVGEKGLFENLRARRASRQHAASLERLRLENAALREEARRLREDASAIETVARQELGLLRPGEVLVILKDVTAANR